MIMRGVVVLFSGKQLLWRGRSVVKFKDGSWCDTATNDGGNNGPGTLSVLHLNGLRVEITEPKLYSWKKRTHHRP